SQEHAEVHAHLEEDASVCQDQAVNKPSCPTRLNRALDWAGLPLSALFLAIGIRDYRDGESVGWPIGGAVLVLVSLWVIYRRMPRRR
ncbi:hypothetical protein ACFT38_46390, partial [Streptomyces sp. NPDC056975]|uniref:hypothetical protein n=1 Tax=Streptomyces sp. NPDC056975 TaxID=3345985 RepID=UPI003628C65C